MWKRDGRVHKLTVNNRKVAEVSTQEPQERDDTVLVRRILVKEGGDV